MREVLSHHADKTEVYLHVNDATADMAGYLLGRTIHADYDSLMQRPEVELRPYQLEGNDALFDAHLEGAKRGLLDVGMGLGKTTMALADAMVFREQEQQQNVASRPTLWLSNSLDLSRQAMRRQVELWPDTNAAMLTPTSRNLDNAEHIFTSLQLMDKIKRHFDPQAFGYITVDESHHGRAPTYEKTIRYFDPGYLLGITGTAYRMDGKELHRIFGDTVFRYPMTRGIAEGWLAKLDYRQQTDQAVRRIMKSSDEDPELSAQLLHNPERYRAMSKIIRKVRREAGDNSRTLIFMPGKKNSRLFQESMPEAEILDSGIPPDEQVAVLERYREEPHGAMVTVDMASEGLDVPKTRIIALGRYTKSRGLFEQQIARGLRLAEGKESLIVLDFAATAERLYVLYSLLKDIRQASREYYDYRRPHEDKNSAEYQSKRDEQVEAFVRSFGFRFTEKQIDIAKRIEQINEARP